MKRSRSGLIFIAIAASLLVSSVWAQDAQAPEQWKLKYRETGGIDGRHIEAVLSSDGQVAAYGITFSASPEQLKRAQALVNALKNTAKGETPKKNQQVIADAVYVTAELTRGGETYQVVSLPDELRQLMRTLALDGRKRAEDDKWAKAGPFKVGRVWRVTEEVRDREGVWHGEQWIGTWTPRADHKTFDIVWRNNKTNQEVRDTIELRSAERGRIALHRDGNAADYSGWYSVEKPGELTGYTNKCQGCTWRAEIEY